jgi:isopentenyl-diphosphate delta-isomerase
MGDDSIFRAKRKKEHIRFSVNEKPRSANFDDISLVHNCLPETNLQEVTLKTSLAGLELKSPLLLNAITGGTSEGAKINKALAEIARECGLAMAVGSQRAAIERPFLSSTFKVARKANPTGVMFANIGAECGLKAAKEAVAMIEADGLQIHLNAPQELAMDREGSSDFTRNYENIKEIIAGVGVPVIVKEVGFGISYREAKRLFDAGAAAVDIGGRGGTNFLRIENLRSDNPLATGIEEWGIATAVSLLEVLHAAGKTKDVVASGGIHSSLNIVKSLVLGAKAVGMAGAPLFSLLKEGKRKLIQRINRIQKEIGLSMAMLGVHRIKDMPRCPAVITGVTAEWLQRRGIPVDHYARR